MSIKVEGLRAFIEGMRKEQQKSRGASAYVAFTTDYALYVHEIEDNYHPVGKAKFLEDPLKTRQQEIMAGIRSVFQRSGDIKQAVYSGGLVLQAFAQMETPVDTGTLRASAQTWAEDD